MCSGNKELLDMWSNFRELSIHAYAQVYKRLHITFDHFEFESQMEAFLPKTLSELSRLNCIKKTNQGTGLYSDFNGKFSPAVLIKDDGTSVYLARDLAAVYSRLATYGEFDWMLYVVGHAQKIHFCQLFYLLKELGFNKNKFIHIPFGKVLGMSTRTGNSVFLEDIINKSKELVKNYMINNMLSKVSRKSIEEASEQLGISAVMVQDLKGSIEKSYEFSWERVLNFKGYTGIYLQYQYARLCSIERENKDIVIGSFDEVDMECLQGSYVVNITRLLDIFPEVVREALDRREPSKIVQYSLQLAKAFSSASKNLYVKDQPENIAKARLLLIGCTKTILQSCLELLNLKPLQKI
ncbi:uncharacterized protein LOC135121028 [Zophobas morio]|uniref:uncharacterized protein LOC135121028 n=1 Tax=Zophobas morio TaxID=2755281 RepID=UPI003083B85E